MNGTRSLTDYWNFTNEEGTMKTFEKDTCKSCIYLISSIDKTFRKKPICNKYKYNLPLNLECLEICKKENGKILQIRRSNDRARNERFRSKKSYNY